MLELEIVMARDRGAAFPYPAYPPGVPIGSPVRAPHDNDDDDDDHIAASSVIIMHHQTTTGQVQHRYKETPPPPSKLTQKSPGHYTPSIQPINAASEDQPRRARIHSSRARQGQ
jgi:hypothetical protein